MELLPIGHDHVLGDFCPISVVLALVAYRKQCGSDPLWRELEFRYADPYPESFRRRSFLTSTGALPIDGRFRVFDGRFRV